MLGKEAQYTTNKMWARQAPNNIKKPKKSIIWNIREDMSTHRMTDEMAHNRIQCITNNGPLLHVGGLWLRRCPRENQKPTPVTYRLDLTYFALFCEPSNIRSGFLLDVVVRNNQLGDQVSHVGLVVLQLHIAAELGFALVGLPFDC